MAKPAEGGTELENILCETVQLLIFLREGAALFTKSSTVKNVETITGKASTCTL
jgi:hypothetical protein